MTESAPALEHWIAAAHWAAAAEVPVWPRLAANPEAGRWLGAELQRRFGGDLAEVYADPTASAYLRALLPQLATGAVPALIAAVGCRPAIARAVTRSEFNPWRERLGPRVHRLVLHPVFSGLGADRAAPENLAAAGAGELLAFWREADLPGAPLLVYLLSPFGAVGGGSLSEQMPAIVRALGELPPDEGAEP